jgi:elongation factor Ts
MSISASLVMELRSRTGAGMMECKKALTETNGDLEAAIEHMRKTGMAKADKKADRIAAEGRVAIAFAKDAKRGAIVEVNCETDFVGGGPDFVGFVGAVAEAALAADASTIEALSAAKLADGTTVDEARRALIAKIGENLALRRVELLTAKGTLTSYLHGTKIGVVVDVSGGDSFNGGSLAKDIAMHVAASKPMCVSADQIPAELLAKERTIVEAQAAASGKPPEIVAKMVDGRLRKFAAESSLLGQPFVKDPDTTVEKLVKQAGATVHGFVRYAVGEGIEKAKGDFVAEVMAQARGG